MPGEGISISTNLTGNFTQYSYEDTKDLKDAIRLLKESAILLKKIGAIHLLDQVELLKKAIEFDYSFELGDK
jgi:hypothetical protein